MTRTVDSMKAAKRQMDDRFIALDMLAGAKATITAYMMATLESPTPELRSMLKNAVTQNYDEFSYLMDLSLNMNWVNPYDVPEQQLAEAYKESQTVVSYHKE